MLKMVLKNSSVLPSDSSRTARSQYTNFQPGSSLPNSPVMASVKLSSAFAATTPSKADQNRGGDPDQFVLLIDSDVLVSTPIGRIAEPTPSPPGCIDQPKPGNPNSTELLLATSAAENAPSSQFVDPRPDLRLIKQTPVDVYRRS